MCARGAYRLEPMEAEMLYVLACRAPSVVAYDALAATLWGRRESPENELGALRVYTSKARRRIAGSGWLVTAEHTQGYRPMPEGVE